jgi:hypothetical protein
MMELSGCRVSCCSEEEEQLRHVTGQVGRHVTKDNLRSGLLTGYLNREFKEFNPILANFSSQAQRKV